MVHEYQLEKRMRLQIRPAKVWIYPRRGLTSCVDNRAMNKRLRKGIVGTAGSSNSAFPRDQFPSSIPQPYSHSCSMHWLLMSAIRTWNPTLGFSYISTTAKKGLEAINGLRALATNFGESHLDDCANAGRHQHQIRCVLVKQIEKDDNLAECSPQCGSHRQPGIRFLAPPKRNVIFEWQKVEQNVNAANEHGAAQQIQIRFREDALHLIDVLLCETKFLERDQCMLHVQYQTQFPDANGRIGEG